MTDHKALSFLNTCKLTHRRITRWVLALQEYNFSWEHIRGVENKVPDTPSRVDFEGNKTGIDLKEIEIYRLSREDKLFGEELKDINSLQRTDVKLSKIITSLESNVDELGYSQYFQIYQGSLFKKVEGESVIGG